MVVQLKTEIQNIYLTMKNMYYGYPNSEGQYDIHHCHEIKSSTFVPTAI